MVPGDARPTFSPRRDVGGAVVFAVTGMARTAERPSTHTLMSSIF
jgi:hypothetical protein